MKEPVEPSLGIVNFREVLLTALMQSAPPSWLQSNCHVPGQTDPATSMFLQITDGGDTAPAMIDLPVPRPSGLQIQILDSDAAASPATAACRRVGGDKGDTQFLKTGNDRWSQ